jgi:plastocyanin
VRLLAALFLVPFFAFANGKVAGVVAFTGRAPRLAKPKVTEPWCADAGVADESVQLADGGKALANVVVYVEVADGGTAVTVPVTVQRCAFAPHVSVGAKVALENADGVLHNVCGAAKVDGKDRIIFDVALLAGTRSTKPAIGEVMKLTCDLHPWETSYLFIAPGPAAKSDASGAFELSLPPGSYTVHAWHEKYGRRAATVTVEEGTSVDPKLSFSDHP